MARRAFRRVLPDEPPSVRSLAHDRQYELSPGTLPGEKLSLDRCSPRAESATRSSHTDRPLQGDRSSEIRNSVFAFLLYFTHLSRVIVSDEVRFDENVDRTVHLAV
jgi:hypothetical protein